MRDGQEHTLDTGELVQGDLLILRPGDQVVAHGPIIGDGRVEINKSLLTGEVESHHEAKR